MYDFQRVGKCLLSGGLGDRCREKPEHSCHIDAHPAR